MPYLKTILTYHMPSEAEVDKSLLESHGITVNLLNNNEARNELGAPFHIQLQVMEDQVEPAISIIKELNPQRFGSVENVRQIERELGGTLLRIMLCFGIAGIATYFLTDHGDFSDRLPAALLGGFIFGLIGYLILGMFGRGSK